MYSFSELKTVIARMAQRSLDNDYKNNVVGDYINLSLQSLYNIYDYWPELRDQHTFTTVDGTALYYMPKHFDKPFRFYDITNDNPLTISTEEEYYDANQANVNNSVKADADTVYPKEVVGVRVQVSTSGSTVKVKSSSSSDSAVTVRIEGYLDSAFLIIGYENIIVTGTSYVSGSTTFYKITHVSKGSDSIGYITVADSSSNVLAEIDSIERVLRYKAFRLGRIPDDSTTSIKVLFKKSFRKLVDDNDYPFAESDNYIIFNSASLSFEQSKEGVDKAAMLKQRAEAELRLLLTNVQGSLGPDYQHKMVSSSMQAHRR